MAVEILISRDCFHRNSEAPIPIVEKMAQNQNDILRYTGLATQWMLLMLLAVYAGYRLDRMLWKAPVFVILLPVATLVLLLWQIIKEFTNPKK